MFPNHQTDLVIHHFSHLFLGKKLKNKHQQTKFQMVIPEKNIHGIRVSSAWPGKPTMTWGMDSIMVMTDFFCLVEPPTPLKTGVKVTWDYCSQEMEKIKMFQTTKQF